MKPLLLKIKGLNNFEKEQFIDFEKLTGLFGIFGPTGSGKSTILDAISIALYGEVSRHSKNNLKQSINNNSRDMYVSLKFKAGNEIYTVERNYSVKNGTLSQKPARFYREEKEQIHIITDKPSQILKEVENILGLSYHDFSRSVVLPQGRFSEFLLLDNLDRRNMLERIFGLEVCGGKLTKRIREEFKNNRAKIDSIENNISVYGDVSHKKINEAQEQHQIELEELTSLKNARVETSANLSEYEKLCELKSEINKHKELEAMLLIRSSEMEKERLILEQAEIVNGIKPQIYEHMALIAKEEALKKEYTAMLETFKALSAKNKKAEEEYAKTSEIKEKEHPRLAALEAQIKQAQILDSERAQLETERQNLLKQYKTIKSNLETKTRQKENSIQEKIITEQKLSGILTRRVDIEISPEDRAVVSEAYELDKKNEKLAAKICSLKAKNEKNAKKHTLEKIKLKQAESEYKILLSYIDEKNKALSSLISPGDTNLLISKKEEISEKEKIVSIKSLLADKLNKLNLDIEQKSTILDKKHKRIESLKVDIEKASHNLLEVTNKLNTARNENMAYILSCTLKENKECPVCGSLNHVKKFARANVTEVLDKLISEAEAAEKEQNLYTQNLQIIIAEERALANELKVLNNERQEISKEFYGFDMSAEKDLLQVLKKEAVELETDIKEWISTKEKLENEIKQKNQKLNEYAIICADLSAGTAKDAAALLEEQANISDMELEYSEDDLKIEACINNIKPNKTIKELYIEMKAFDKERAEITKSESILRESLDKTAKNLEELSSEISTLETEKSGVEVSGQRIQQSIGMLDSQIKQVSSNKPLKVYLEEVTLNIKEILQKAHNAKQHLDTLNAKNKQAEENLSLVKNQLEAHLGIVAVSDRKLSGLLENAGYKSAEEALLVWLDEVVRNEKKTAIAEYDQRVKKTANILADLYEKLGYFKKRGQDIENCEKITKEYAEKLKIILEKSEKKAQITAVIKERIEKMSEALEQITLLKKQKDELIKMEDLLIDLDELFKGNRFVEYVSKRQLSYITTEASSRLKEMTSGRYAMELDDTDFIIRDDYNGGVRRSPRTLSGGETFMASLCLALALSTKIQLKNKAPMELFFLDEGFGTLDSKLLDVVMSCLERLPSEKMSVGVITHIEELKNRIPKKLNAIQTAGGSRLEMDV